MVEITCDDPNLIGSRDFSRFMPVLQILSQDHRGKYDKTIIDKWSSLLGPGLVATGTSSNTTNIGAVELVVTYYQQSSSNNSSSSNSNIIL